MRFWPERGTGEQRTASSISSSLQLTLEMPSVSPQRPALREEREEGRGGGRPAVWRAGGVLAGTGANARAYGLREGRHLWCLLAPLFHLPHFYSSKTIFMLEDVHPTRFLAPAAPVERRRGCRWDSGLTLFPPATAGRLLCEQKGRQAAARRLEAAHSLAGPIPLLFSPHPTSPRP